MNIGTNGIKERNITQWHAWFTTMILLGKLDIEIFNRWISRKGFIVEQATDLIKQLEKAHTYEFRGLWISSITLFISFLLNFMGTNSTISNWFVIVIITTTTAFIVYSKKRVSKATNLIYQFRDEYENLIFRLNFGSSQQSFSEKTLTRRVSDFLESQAEELERKEGVYGRLSDEAENDRKKFKEMFGFYQYFGLTLDSFDPYFPGFKKDNP